MRVEDENEEENSENFYHKKCGNKHAPIKQTILNEEEVLSLVKI